MTPSRLNKQGKESMAYGLEKEKGYIYIYIYIHRNIAQATYVIILSFLVDTFKKCLQVSTLWYVGRDEDIKPK